ncbi:transient receptor potential (TRP) ion channel domain-containing protein [Hirsutella rhossiliensis]
MARSRSSAWTLPRALLILALVASTACAADILKTDGFSNCGTDDSIKVDKVDITFDKDQKSITFDVAGTSLKEQNVTAVLNVTAYGNAVFSNSFNPCDKATFVGRLCPVPSGDFAAQGAQQIPGNFADMIPAIAFQVPDIAAQATLQLNSVDGGKNVACIRSQVSNGKSANVPAVQYIAAGIAGVALIASGVSSLSAVLSGSGGCLGTVSPSFTETFGWFQGMAMNGMLSVNYPPVYRSFSKNFAFSTCLIPWVGLQTSIDGFRAKTGGNLTEDSVEFLKNATLVFPDGSTASPTKGLLKFKRALDDFAVLATREAADSSNQTSAGFQHAVKGIQAYAEKLAVPRSDVFMTVLLIVAIIIAAIVVGILLVKVILEAWALFGSFPKSLAGFRKHYWGSIARTITSLILILYGIWVLYCIFQFTHGDTLAAKALAAVTLVIFTGILAFFTWKIWSTARQLKKAGGDADGLYYDKKIWVKYSLFYESYKKNYWWLFVPAIVYMFVKGAVLAATDGSGLIQSVSQLIIEAVMLILLLWSRPYERKSGNVVNIAIAVVRVLSVACILVFVEEFGIRQTTQTVAGVVLIAVQSALTGILAILIAWNAFNACCKANPHRKRRKEMEKKQRDMDNLTPLDARNTLLLDHQAHPSMGGNMSVHSFSTDYSREKPMVRSGSPERYYPVGQEFASLYPAHTPTTDASRRLVDDPAPMGMEREYRGPVGSGFGYGQGAYGQDTQGAYGQGAYGHGARR